MNAPLGFMDEIGAAVAHGSRERRTAMLRHVADLFAANAEHYGDTEIALFDDVIDLLTAEIEFEARVMLADRLAPIPNAPPRIAKSLALDDAIEVAGPMLSQSGRLDDAVLITAARTKSQQHLYAICHRNFLSEAVCDSVIARGDRRVLMKLAENPGARISVPGFARIAERAHGDEPLTERLGLRADIPRPVFLRLLAQASENARARLIAAHPELGAEIGRAVADVAGGLQAATSEASAEFLAAQSAVSAHRPGELRDNYVEIFSRAGQFEETAFAFSQLCELPVHAVERALGQRRAETVLILSKAAGLSWPATRAVLQMRAEKFGFPAGDLEQARASFERLKPATAQELVRFYRLRESKPANKLKA
jgi:uncharacterized protein (DUF2336 family)